MPRWISEWAAFVAARLARYSVICASGSREEFCDRNTFDGPDILTRLRRSAERKRPLGAKQKQLKTLIAKIVGHARHAA
jgi:hypothetical protein